jgi:hypothetical protein
VRGDSNIRAALLLISPCVSGEANLPKGSLTSPLELLTRIKSFRTYPELFLKLREPLHPCLHDLPMELCAVRDVAVLKFTPEEEQKGPELRALNDIDGLRGR